LRANPATRLRIEGHASAEGTAEYNLALGERRALAAQNYLASQGIDRGRLTTLSYGEERPKLPNTSEENRAQNRRAAFVVQ
jgi:peptidoglycan-associated lipoprotein